jgi:hypothetical protein
LAGFFIHLLAFFVFGAVFNFCRCFFGFAFGFGLLHGVIAVVFVPVGMRFGNLAFQFFVGAFFCFGSFFACLGFGAAFFFGFLLFFAAILTPAFLMSVSLCYFCGISLY